MIEIGLAILAVICTIGLAVGASFLEGWLFMVIVNWALGLFGVAFALTFWQAFAVCLVLNFIKSLITGGTFFTITKG